MKKTLLMLVAACLLLSATACSNSRREDDLVGSGIYGDESVYDSISDDISDDAVTLEDLDGWWHLADDYLQEGEVMVRVFRLDAGAGTWAAYDEWGEEFYVDQAYLADDGSLCLAFELGDAYFFPAGSEMLLDDAGEVAFVLGGPPEARSAGGMDGKWYKNGDTSAKYYLFEGNTCKEIPFGVEPSDISGIPFLLKEQGYYRQDGSLASGTAIERDDAFAIDTLILSDDGDYFFILHDYTFYLREDVVGTPRGDEIIGKYRLMSVSWGFWSDEGYERLELCEGDIFVLNQQDGTDVTLKDSGTWSLHGDALTLHFADGGSEELVLSEDPQSLTVERYGFTFTERGE